MKKLLLIAIAGLMSTSASWGLNFSWNLPITGVTPVTISHNPGYSDGGDLSRFFGPGTTDHTSATGSAIDGGAHDDALGDYVSIFRVGTIQQGIDTYYNTGNGQVEIWGMLYGMHDVESRNNLDGGGNGTIEIDATGGRLEFWLVDVPDDQNSFSLSDLGYGGRDNTATVGMTYDNITNNGAVPFVAFNLLNDVNGISETRLLTFTGFQPAVSGNDGGFLADVDATWDNYDVYGKHFDTGTQAGGADLEGDYTMNINPAAGSGDFALLYLGDHLTAIQPIPEPSTLLLLGTGLLGMVGYARRRRS